MFRKGIHTDMVKAEQHIKPIDFRKLWETVIAQFPMSIHSVHGPKHWKQVEKNAFYLRKKLEGMKPSSNCFRYSMTPDEKTRT
jgi:hypothetical protein